MWHMIIWVVAIVFVAGTLNHWITTKGKIAESKSGADASALKALEQRVATLEKIVTDRGHQLKEEIDAL